MKRKVKLIVTFTHDLSGEYDELSKEEIEKAVEDEYAHGAYGLDNAEIDHEIIIEE